MRFCNRSLMKKCNFVTGAKDSGKTSYLKALSKSGGFKGFLEIADSAEKQDLYLYYLEEGKKVPFMKGRTPYPLVFEKANNYLLSIREGKVIIDEMGKIEIRGSGFFPAVKELAKRDNVTLFIAVRDIFLEELIAKLEIADYEIIKAGEASP